MPSTPVGVVTPGIPLASASRMRTRMPLAARTAADLELTLDPAKVGGVLVVLATLALYLDIVNVFQSLLALLGIFGGERD